MPLEKMRLEVFVEGNPALEFVYRGIKAREVAGVRCAWCDKTFDSVDMSDGRLFTMIHEHVTKSNFHDHLRRHGGVGSWHFMIEKLGLLLQLEASSPTSLLFVMDCMFRKLSSAANRSIPD